MTETCYKNNELFMGPKDEIYYDDDRILYLGTASPVGGRYVILDRNKTHNLKDRNLALVPVEHEFIFYTEGKKNIEATNKEKKYSVVNIPPGYVTDITSYSEKNIVQKNNNIKLILASVIPSCIVLILIVVVIVLSLKLRNCMKL